MKKIKLLLSAVLAVFIVCCNQTNLTAQEPCEFPTGLDITSTLVGSGPGFCEYQVSVTADFPLDGGVYCADWFLGGTIIGAGDLNQILLLECDTDPVELCARVYCCENPDVIDVICDLVTADCCSDPCEPLSTPPVIVNVTTPNNDCELRLETNAPPGYCKEWTVDGVTVLSGPDENSLVLTGCEEEGFHIICLRVTCCDTGEVVWEECGEYVLECDDCPCDPIEALDILPSLISLDDCTYQFDANLIGSSSDLSEYCYNWYVNGIYAGSTPSLIHNFDCEDDTTNEVCLEVYCCDDGEILANHCIPFNHECDCECTPPSAFQIASSIDADNCEYTFSIDPFLLASDNYCVAWSLDGGPYVDDATADDLELNFTCEDNGGHYVCARIYCCDRPDVFVENCVDFSVDCDCECTPPSAFQIASSIDAANCEYTFSIDPFLLTSDNYCVAWSLDGGPYVDDATTDDLVLNFTCEDNGGHYVCARIYCCDRPDVFVENCVDFSVDCECPCTPPGEGEVDIIASQDECVYTFTPFLDGVELGYPYCWQWIYSGVYSPVINADQSITFDFTGECVEFELGIKVVCCDDEFPFGNGSWINMDIDCCCDPTALPQGDLNIEQNGDCDYTVKLDFPAGVDTEDLCFNWTLDGVAQITDIATPFQVDLDFTCEDNGWHVVCVEYTCCDNPGEPIQICTELYVDCPCTHPFALIASVENCSACFTPIYEGPCPADVIFYDYGNGQTGTDPCHTYDTPGNYIVCVTTCCSSNIDAAGNVIDPTLCVETCTEIFIEGPCCPELPSQTELSIAVSKDENCLHFFELGSMIGTDLSGFCVQWSLDGGPWVDGGLNYTHQFTCFDPVGHYICARLFCCENPDEYVEVCTDFETNCPCLLPSSIGFDYTITEECNVIVSPWWTDDYCGDICWDFTLDGISVGDENTGIINLPGSGSYTLCFTATCCNNPNQTMTTCETIEVNCCDEEDLNPSIDVQEDGCIWTFTPMNNGVPLVPGIDCYTWDLESLAGPDGSVTLDMTDYCPGFFGVCIEVWCCQDEEIRLGICYDYIVDCCDPCPQPSLDDYFTAIDQDTDCYEWTFTNDIAPLDINNQYCYMWCVDGVVQGTMTDLNYTFPADGTYDVCLKVFCCETWDFLGQWCETITVDCDPCPHECDVHAFWQETVSGNTVTFTDFSTTGPGTTITGWDWTFGDGNTSTLQNPVHTYATAGTYTVNLTVYAVYLDGTVCESHFCWTVKTDCDAECNLDAQFDYDIDQSDCTVYFIDLSTFSPGTSIISWDWNFGDGNTSTVQNPVHTYTTSGVYTVTLTITGFNGVTTCTDTFQTQISVECGGFVECEGDPYFKYKLDDCYGQFYDYSSSPYSIVNVNWDFGDGSLPVNTTAGGSVGHFFPGTGSYLVTITVTINTGFTICILQYQDIVNVNCGIIWNDDLPNGLTEQDLVVYPNPTSDQVIIELLDWNTEEKVSVEIFSVTGEKVGEEEMETGNGPLELSLEKYETGLYTLVVKNSEEFHTSRVVKE